MSFSSDLKQEILINRPRSARCKQAHAYGLFLFGRAFSSDEISLHTESAEVAQLFRTLARRLLGQGAEIALAQRSRNGRVIHTAELPRPEDRAALLSALGQAVPGAINRKLIADPEQLAAFLAGAYLACGSATDPEKSYHMEFCLRDRALAEDFAALLGEAIPGVRKSSRRGSVVLYYKECGPIEDLMTLMGATKSCLAVIDIETYKSVRNRANRAVNCETANIDKLVSASAKQIEDIGLVIASKGEEGLPESLAEVARLRLAHPEASLRELAALTTDSLSRSGVHHRLDKLGQMAEEIRRESEGGAEDV